MRTAKTQYSFFAQCFQEGCPNWICLTNKGCKSQHWVWIPICFSQNTEYNARSQQQDHAFMISILTLRLERLLLASLKVTESFPLIVFLLKNFLIEQQHRWELLSIAVAVWTFISLLCSFVSCHILAGSYLWWISSNDITVVWNYNGRRSFWKFSFMTWHVIWF